MVPDGVTAQPRTCPSPVTTYVVLVSSASPMGPRACSFCVEMPISAPKPNSPPSVNRVDALTITTAASTPVVKVAIVVNSKAQRVSVCNAAETMLVHRDIADEFVPRVFAALREAGVTVHGDARLAGYAADSADASRPSFIAVTDEDWAAEYYSLDLAAGVVDTIDEAIDHIRRWSTGHTEAIVSDSVVAVEKFVAEVDAAAVMVNASTRFTDGGEFGFGAEIGISTQKLHARGPMGLPELTTTKYVVTGHGHLRG